MWEALITAGNRKYRIWVKADNNPAKDYDIYFRDLRIKVPAKQQQKVEVRAPKFIVWSQLVGEPSPGSIEATIVSKG